MRRILAVAMVMVIAIAMGSVACALPTTAELIEKMTAAVEKMRSFEFDTRIINQLPGEPGLTTNKHVATVKSQMADKTVERSYEASKSTRIGPDGKETPAGEDKRVIDGTFTWQEEHNTRTGGIGVLKFDAVSSNAAHVADFVVGDIKKNVNLFDLKVTGEDVIDGQKMYVLEGVCKPDPKTDVSWRYWVGQDDLVLHRAINTYQNEDTMPKPMVSTVNYTNVKINRPVDSKLFVYTPPPGAVIVDLTKRAQTGK